MEWIWTTDVRILYWLQRFAGPHMNTFIIWFTWGINCFLFWLCLAAAGLWRKRSRWLTITIVMAVFLALLIGDLTLKPVVMRLRPYMVLPEAPLLTALPYPVSYSFPSGHSFFFFAGATVIYHYRHRLGLAAYVFAGVVAFSRMYLFMHFPSDVLAGAVLGIGAGLAACRLCSYMRVYSPAVKTTLGNIYRKL